MNGDRLRERRKILGLSAERLADLLGTTRVTVARWETGKHEPDDAKKKQLAEALNTSVAYLLGEIDDPQPITPLQGSIKSTWKATGSPSDAPKEESSYTSNGRVADPEKILAGDRRGLKAWLKERGIYMSEDLIYLPVLSPELTACCGRGISILDCTSLPEETMPFDRKDLGCIDDYNPPYVVNSEGSSMEGYNIPNGAKCAVNPAEEVGNGDIAFIKFGDDAMIKKVYWRRDGAELRSSDGEVIMVSKEDFESGWVQIVGRVMSATLKL